MSAVRVISPTIAYAPSRATHNQSSLKTTACRLPMRSSLAKAARLSNKRVVPANRKTFVVSASDDADKVTEATPEPVKPVKPEEPDENVPGFNMKRQDGSELTVGPVGTALLWGLLIVLFGLSLFFTFARAFLPDLEAPAVMDEMALIPLMSVIRLYL
mmetsp:Transcript_39762/g.66712  ORF Transcript_39762/g.66712 Transcript_39762/m.66712 type:complete len:158 (+) Transcript_39762:100-573(+)|eukprot:CAMPEP_0198213858 /NCGR_PEP_ID=MMETSP1445-20131203/34693_1 /TAXON_ID=36898 /ORGANISM="Pyramimonas sp., Strain CCMP2087" /LENGTH=157 /DNA_ID=CAMNT_0043888707 /DNA_START=90 /DNA_END=563 /DNA_ORIENTATION=-